MRLPMYSGVQAIVGVRLQERLPELLGREEPVVRDAEDERRVAAPAVRVAVHDLGRGDEPPAVGQVADDLVGRFDGREPVQPAVRVVEVAGLVHGREDGEAVLARQLEVLAAAARRDVDDARPLVERDLVPRDDAMLDPGRGGEVVERALVASGRRAPSPRTVRVARSSGKRSRATQAPSSRRMYSASGLTAAATFAGSVHGVVVQTTSDSPSRSRSGRRTKTDGSVLSR